MTDICTVCGVELNDDNWYPSSRKMCSYICSPCHLKRGNIWRKANLERYNEMQRRRRAADPDDVRTRSKAYEAMLKSVPFNENKGCSDYLGIYIAERVLRNIFKDVEVMPPNNPGYDFICSRGMRVDVKSSCLTKDGKWMFTIRHNTSPDYFLCIAFDDRENLVVQHLWLLPCDKFCHLVGAAISPNTVDRWDDYKIDISKVLECCDMMKGDNNV